MKRDRGYFRMQRRRTIRRRERLLRRLGGESYLHAWSRGVPGRLAKGKIHCSCPMCRTKSYDRPSRRDMRSEASARSQLYGEYRIPHKANV